MIEGELFMTTIVIRFEKNHKKFADLLERTKKNIPDQKKKDFEKIQKKYIQLYTEIIQDLNDKKLLKESFETVKPEQSLRLIFKQINELGVPQDVKNNYLNEIELNCLSAKIAFINQDINQYINSLKKGSSMSKSQQKKYIEIKKLWKTFRNDIQVMERRVELFNPNITEFQFKATLMWMIEQGNEEDLSLIKKVRSNPPYNSIIIEELFNIAVSEISKKIKQRNKNKQEFKRFPIELEFANFSVVKNIFKNVFCHTDLRLIKKNIIDLIGYIRNFDKTVSCLPYVQTEQAEQIASIREKRIKDYLKKYERFLTNKSTNIFQEFIELPPEIKPSQLRVFNLNDGNDRVELTYHIVNLKSELKHKKYLLAGRINDVITCLNRTGLLAPKDDFSMLYLDSIPLYLDKNNLYPWRVVIDTSNYDKLLEILSLLDNWLGIGVDFLLGPKKKIIKFGQGQCESQCDSSRDIRTGVVSGIIEDSESKRFGVSCLHSVNYKCRSNFMKKLNDQFPEETTTLQSVDITLLDFHKDCIRDRCFEFQDNLDFREINIAEPEEIELFLTRRMSIIKTPNDNKKGVILHEVPSIMNSDTGELIRCPHLMIVRKNIVPLQRILMDFLGMGNSLAFSQGGDSGTWVTDSEHQFWFGMIVRGTTEPLTSFTYAIPSYVLIEFYREILNQNNSTYLIPKRIVKNI